MIQGQENLYFLTCPQCQGQGYILSKKCLVCQERGLISYADGYILYWGNRAYSGENEPIIKRLYLGLLNLFRRNKKSKVLVKKYKSSADFCQNLPPRIDWAFIDEISSSDLIDVSQAFDQAGYKVINQAYNLAEKLQATEVEPIHFILAAITHCSDIENFLSDLGADPAELIEELSTILGQSELNRGYTLFGVSALKTLIKAYHLAYLNKLPEVGVWEIFLAALKSDVKMQEILAKAGLDLQHIEALIGQARGSRKHFETRKIFKFIPVFIYLCQKKIAGYATPCLHKYACDLTAEARLNPAWANYESPVYERIFRHLENSQLKSLIFVDETGLNSQALAKGLACRINDDYLPKIFSNKKLFCLDTDKLLAGATISEAHKRLFKILQESISAQNIILFINNLHDILGLGEVFADLLEQALLDKNFMLLAFTTPADYQRFIEANGWQDIFRQFKVQTLSPSDNFKI
jgi:ATP-dependent Clp protease ATP-binding subunit ClpA